MPSDATPSRLSADERAQIRGELLRLAWPVVLQNLVRTTMFLVDTVMIGRVGQEAMAALAVVGPIAHTVASLLMALSVGAVATVARAWGEGDREKQGRAAATSLALAAGIGVPMSLLGVSVLPLATGFFEVEGASGVTLSAAAYLRYQGAVLFFFCVDFVSSGILRAAGNTRVPMITAVIGNAVNVFLNWVFIFGNLGAEPMGVEGAGLATALAAGVQGCLTAGYLFTAWSPIRIGLASLASVTRESVGSLLKVTSPAVLEPIVMQSGFLGYAMLVSSLGVVEMAAHRSAIAVESLTFMPGFGFAVAGSALVGQFLGAGRPDKSEAALRECARLATILMCVIGAAFLLWPEPLVRVFLPGDRMGEVVPLAAVCLAICAFEQPFLALSMAYQGAFRGAGDTRTPLLVAFIGVWFVRIPLAWFLAFPMKMGLQGIWITMIADWAVRSVVFYVLFRRGRWKTIKL